MDYWPPFHNSAAPLNTKSIFLRALEYVTGDPTTPILAEKGKSAITSGNLAYVTTTKEITVDIVGNHKISVFSPEGKKVFGAKGSKKATYAPPAFTKPGLYLVEVELGPKAISQRIMIY